MQLSSYIAVHNMIAAEIGQLVPAKRSAYLLIILRQSPRFCGLGLGSTVTAGRAAAGISVNAIAASFRQPFETARRHVNALISQGFCYRDGSRTFVSPEPLASPGFERMLTTIHDVMIRLIEQCRSLGVPLPEPRANSAYDPDTTIAVAIDLLLAVYEYGAPHYSSWLQMRVISAILCANGRRIASDPELAERYGMESAVPPDAMLVPVTGRAVARAIRLPYPTVRRQIDAALDKGWLVRSRGGVKRSRAHATSPLSAELDRMASLRVIKAFERLAPAGFRFDDPAGHYAGREPPPLLDFS